MRASTKKSLRDIGRQKGQVIGVGFTILLGVAMFVLTGGAYLNLDASYHYSYDRLHFATLIGTSGDPDAIAQAALDAGAEQAITRTQLDRPMEIGDTKLLGRVVSFPDSGEAAVDNVDVLRGDGLTGAAGEVLLEYHAADAFGLEPGDTFQVFGTTGWQTATVAGVVESPEYLWPARSRQDVFPDPMSFAVAFIPDATFDEWYGPDTANETLVLMPADAAQADTDAVSAAMTDAGAADVVGWEDQPSHATLDEDLSGFQMMSWFFPALFLIAAGVASYVLLARRILQEKPVIGTLMAAGARPGRVLWHYLSQGVAVGFVAAVIGVVLGAAGAGAATEAYTGVLGIPDTIVEIHWELIGGGLAFGVIVGMLGALGPAISAARTKPAEAMRSQAPVDRPDAWSRMVARMTALPATTRMALRDVGRSKRRTFATALGAVLALVLVFPSVGMITSMLAAIDLQFGEIDTSDASVAVVEGVGTSELEAVDGIDTVEQVVVGQVTAEAGGESYTTTLTGYQTDTELHGFFDRDGNEVAVPTDGVLASYGIASVLDVEIGDTITVATDDGSANLELTAFVEDTVGSALYTAFDTADAVLPATGADFFQVGFADGADRTTIREDVTQLDGVASYTDNGALRELLNQYLGLVWVFIILMVGLGTVLSLTVMYVTMAVNIVERTGELATLRAAGVSLRRVANVIATENLVATAIGLPFGVWLGVLATNRLLAMYSDDLFQFRLEWPWWLPVLIALGVLLAAAVSLLPAMRAVRKIDVATVVRERAA